jgi:hypothetical protein
MLKAIFAPSPTSPIKFSTGTWQSDKIKGVVEKIDAHFVFFRAWTTRSQSVRRQMPKTFSFRRQP